MVEVYQVRGPEEEGDKFRVQERKMDQKTEGLSGVTQAKETITLLTVLGRNKGTVREKVEQLGRTGYL